MGSLIRNVGKWQLERSSQRRPTVSDSSRKQQNLDIYQELDIHRQIEDGHFDIVLRHHCGRQVQPASSALSALDFSAVKLPQLSVSQSHHDYNRRTFERRADYVRVNQVSRAHCDRPSATLRTVAAASRDASRFFLSSTFHSSQYFLRSEHHPLSCQRWSA